MKACSKKYHLSDIDEIGQTGFSNNSEDDFSFYLRQDKKTFLQRHFADDMLIQQQFVVDDFDYDDDHQMALPIIFGLTCPHPTDLQANAHTQVVIINSWIIEPQAHRLIVQVTLGQKQLYRPGLNRQHFGAIQCCLI